MITAVVTNARPFASRTSDAAVVVAIGIERQLADHFAVLVDYAHVEIGDQDRHGAPLVRPQRSAPVERGRRRRFSLYEERETGPLTNSYAL